MTDILEVKEWKASMRLQMMGRLAGQRPGAKEGGERKIRAHLESFVPYQRAHSVMYYVGVGSEIDTSPFITQALKKRKQVFVPSCLTKEGKLLVSRLFDLAELAPGYYGLLEPKEEFLRPHDPDCLDLIILPGLAFDLRGNRLGRGGGYYDRLLAQVHPWTLLIALAFDFQVQEQIPAEDHDLPLDIIITPSRIITCRPQTGER